MNSLPRMRSDLPKYTCMLPSPIGGVRDSDEARRTTRQAKEGITFE